MRIALIGYGEVGRILAEDLRAANHDIVVFDVKLGNRGDDSARQLMLRHAQRHGAVLADSHTDAVRDSELAICAVTAAQTIAAASACAGALPPRSFFLDFNSASPSAKLAAGSRISAGGARYVEGAVMTSVPPHRCRVPLLLGGPDAEALAPILRKLGFAPKVVSRKLGVASATKMCRSVVVKGLEAVLIESFTAARYYGVEEAVIESLRETFPGFDWNAQGTYFFQRAIEHGRRRSEEMREAASTVREAGLEPLSAAGTAERQAWIADLAERAVFGSLQEPGFARSPDWRTEADRLLALIEGRHQ